MLWFSGSIPQAVQTAKTNRAVFVVYITGKDDLSKEMDRTWQDASVEAFFAQNKWVALKLEASSEACAQFSAIYPVVCVPCTFFIGEGGSPLDVTAGHQDPATFQQTLNKVLKLHQSSQPSASKSPESAPSTSKSSDSAPTQSVPVPDITEDSLYSSDDEKSTSTPNPQASTATQSTSKSTEERVERAKALLAQKQEEKARKAVEEAKQKENERRELGRNMAKFSQWKEEREQKERVDSWKKEKEESQKARERVRQQIAQDKAERAARFNKESEAKPATASEKPAQAKPKTNRDIARIQFRLPDGSTVTEQFPSSNKLQEAKNFIQQRLGSGSYSLATVFPRRQFTTEDLDQSLLDLDLAPAAVLLVHPSRGAVSSDTDRPSGGGSVLSFIWMLLAPFITLWNMVTSVFLGPSSPPVTDKEEEPRPETTPDPDTASSSSRSTRPKSSYGVRSRARGNIHRLHDQDKDDDDMATWNGNSTQQM